MFRGDAIHSVFRRQAWALAGLLCASMAEGVVPHAAIAWPSLYFEANHGQAPTEIGYLSRGPGYTLGLTAAGATIVLHEAARRTDARPALRITPVGTAQETTGVQQDMRGEELLPGRSHYFIGNAPQHWLTGIEHFRKVRYPRLYPGIDMVFHGSAGLLEFDFVLEPGARVEQIRLRISGADRVRLDERGRLVLRTGEREVILRAPFAYQDVAGARREIASAYRLLDETTVGFQLAAYDASQTLVIDPILDFSSYAGGAATDIAQGVVFDAEGDIYVVGETYSTDFPMRDPYQPTSPLNGSAFVMKLDGRTHDVVYATYLGSNVTEARGIAVDATGSATIVGDTSSTTFPLASPYQSSFGGLIDIFVSRLSPAGDELIYSTYLGGDQVDRGRAIALDTAGDVYITGVTSSTDFPRANPQQTVLRGSTDAYVAKLSPARGTLDYSTYLGAGGLEYGTSIAVDTGRRAFVAGYTNSGLFPVLNPLQATKAGANDGFVLRFSAQGDLEYSSFLGGAGNDYANAIALDASGNIVVAGQTDSQNFPRANALQASLAGATDAFAAKLNASGSALLYATYLGGAQSDAAYALRLDAAGNAYLAGMTASGNFPAVRAVQPGNAGGQDAFVTQLAADGSAWGYSTCLGGAANDYARAIAVDPFGDVAVVGATESDNLPRVDANQAARAGGSDAFIALLLADGDADGVADRDDNCLGLANPDQADLDADGSGDACDVDRDGDGLNNTAEGSLGTDASNPDTDADGLGDGDEVNVHATDPLAADSDSDGLNDGNEVMRYGTDPNRSDVGDLAPLAAPNGQVDLADLLILLRYLHGRLPVDAKAAALADIDRNGALDVRDALQLRRQLNGQ